MNWARMLAYITGTVDQELLLRNEYLAAENRILKAQIKGRLLLSEADKATLAEIAHLWSAKTSASRNLHRCVVGVEIALLQQLLNIAQRKRIAKIPPDRTKYKAGFGLPPFEDRGSGSHLAILSRHQPAALKVATHPPRCVSLATSRISGLRNGREYRFQFG